MKPSPNDGFDMNLDYGGSVEGFVTALDRRKDEVGHSNLKEEDRERLSDIRNAALEILERKGFDWRRTLEQPNSDPETQLESLIDRYNSDDNVSDMDNTQEIIDYILGEYDKLPSEITGRKGDYTPHDPANGLTDVFAD